MTRKFHCRAFCFTGSMHWEFRVLAGEIRHILAGEIKWISTHMLHGKDACQRCVNFLHWFRDNGDPYDLGIPYKIVVTSHLLTMLYENRMLCLWFETHLMKIWSFVCDQNPLSALSHSHPWFISIRLTETKCCYYDMLTHLSSYRDGGDPKDTTSIVPFSGLKTKKFFIFYVESIAMVFWCWQVIIGLDNGLVPFRYQAIIQNQWWPSSDAYMPLKPQGVKAPTFGP